MKYKLLAYIPAMVAAMTSFLACSDDFLDRKVDGNYITPDQMEKASEWNPKILLGETQGITSSLIRWQAGGTTGQHDFGQKSTDISTDIISHDMVFSQGCSYGWFQAEAQGTATNKTSARTQIAWYNYYKVIDACNFSFTTVGSDEVEPDNAQNKLYFAQAKTARAYAYLQLETLFAGNYETDKDKKVLPIYREQSDSYHAPETNEKVYEQILFDLDGAIEAFNNAATEGVTSSSIDQPSIAVAYTLKAYAYLQMGEYDKAVTNAQNAIDAAGKRILPESDLNYGFNTINNNNWMWGVDIPADNTGGLCTFWGMMDYYTYSYVYAGDWKVINSDLFNEIPESDARRNWFTTSPYYQHYQGTQLASLCLLPTGKFHSAISTTAGGDTNWESDIHFMRIEECYLIAAEAEARLGNLSNACNYLKAILDNRDTVKADEITNMNQHQLLDEIFFNWRIELWGEGKSLMTFKRFKKNITCPSNDAYDEQGTIQSDSKSLIFAIPEHELKYNSLMKDADQ